MQIENANSFRWSFIWVVCEVREEKVVKVAGMVKVIRVVRVGLEVRLVRMVGVGRVADLDALLLEIGCGQKDPQRGEAGNPQFHIFRCTSISWIHVGESVTQSLNHSCF